MQYDFRDILGLSFRRSHNVDSNIKMPSAGGSHWPPPGARRGLGPQNNVIGSRSCACHTGEEGLSPPWYYSFAPPVWKAFKISKVYASKVKFSFRFYYSYSYLYFIWKTHNRRACLRSDAVSMWPRSLICKMISYRYWSFLVVVVVVLVRATSSKA